MKKFEIRKILIPTDFSETSMLAIEHGGFMAKLFKAEIILLHVLEQNYVPFNIVEPEVTVGAPSDLAEKIQKRLDDLAESTREEFGVKTTSLSTDGNICHEIVNISKDNDIDIVIMGTHGVSGFEELFIGSNAYKVLTMLKCPILSVQNHAKNIGFTNILLPVDNSEHSRQKINQAVVLAKHYASNIHILGLLNEDDDAKTEKIFEIKLNQVQAYLEKNSIPFTRKTLRGKNQATLTMSYAEGANTDLIMIMTDQEGDDSFLSSYAQQVVNHSKIPVMSVTPEEHPENIPWVHPY